MTQGGKRKGAGRKPEKDKKQQVPLYVPTSRIEKLGIDDLKSIALAAIEKAYKKAIKINSSLK